jgi:uncharacterized peroxidase-related enzyme
MPRLTALATTEAPAAAQPLLENVRRSLGLVPNLLATLAHSPAALQSYLSFSQAIGGASLSATLREQIALAVAGENTCDYCASAHTALGKAAGIPDDELALNLRGDSNDAKAKAALDFSRDIVLRRGRVSDKSLAAVRGAGFSEAEIVEIVVTVALNIFTNYFNHVAETEIDFPVVDALHVPA